MFGGSGVNFRAFFGGDGGDEAVIAKPDFPSRSVIYMCTELHSSDERRVCVG